MQVFGLTAEGFCSASGLFSEVVEAQTLWREFTESHCLLPDSVGTSNEGVGRPFCLHPHSPYDPRKKTQGLLKCCSLCNLMDCSMQAFLSITISPSLEFAQTQVHGVSDAIQASHPLSTPSPPAFSLSALGLLDSTNSTTGEPTFIFSPEFGVGLHSWRWKGESSGLESG